MTNYTQIKSFTTKDGLTAGDPNKKVLGSDLDAEFNAIRASILTKWDSSTVVPVANGGTGATTVAGALTNLGIGDYATTTGLFTHVIRDKGGTSDSTSPVVGNTLTVTAGDIGIMWLHAGLTVPTAGTSNWTMSYSSGDGAAATFYNGESSIVTGTWSRTDVGYSTAYNTFSVPFTITTGGTLAFVATWSVIPSSATIDYAMVYALLFKGA